MENFFVPGILGVIVLIALFGVSLYRYMSAKKQNKTAPGTVKRIDEYERIVLMSNDKKIKIDEIYAIESDLFYSLGLD